MTHAPDVVPICLRVPRREIAYVKFVFESYEGVATVRTLDRHRATLVVLTTRDFERVARAVVASLAAEGVCEESAPPADFDGDWLGPDDDAGRVRAAPSPPPGPRQAPAAPRTARPRCSPRRARAAAPP